MAGTGVAVRRASSIKAKKSRTLRTEVRRNPAEREETNERMLPAGDFGPEEWSVLFGFDNEGYLSFYLGMRTHKRTGNYFYNGADFAKLSEREQAFLFKGERMLGFFWPE